MGHLGDKDGDGTISKDEFLALLLRPDAARVLDQVCVDVVGLASLKDFIFEDGIESLSFQDLFKLILSLRGNNTATVKDLVDLRKFFAQEMDAVRESVVSGISTLFDQAQQHHLQARGRVTPTAAWSLS